MARNTNYRYETKSNIRFHMDRDYKNRRASFEAVGSDFKWSDYYEMLAKFCGVSPSTISQMRLKRAIPSLIVAVKLSEWLGVSVAELVSIVEKESPLETPKCIVAGCERHATTKGYCMKHVPSIYK
ncbi:hypothetical protein LC76P1_00198 [Lysinibacillus phage LC76P1]|nr:hypothetical protein LC76P1_00198 [Lysinibacillus phage LC76P1]